MFSRHVANEVPAAVRKVTNTHIILILCCGDA
jgi:hypothetical protein